MKRLTILFILFSIFCFGQQNSLKEDSQLFPLYVVDGVVTNESQLKTITSPDEISSVSIYKYDNLPENLNPFLNFISQGIIAITLKDNSKPQPAISLESLNIQHQLNKLNPVYINKILVKNNRVEILTSAIIETEIISNNHQKFLNIWTVTKAERTSVAKRKGGIKLTPKEKTEIKNVILK